MDNIENKKLLNVKQTIIVMVFCVSSTFALTKIYDRFELLEAQNKVDKQSIIKVDERHDRKFKRLQERVETLEKPNTDKNR